MKSKKYQKPKPYKYSNPQTKPASPLSKPSSSPLAARPHARPPRRGMSPLYQNPGKTARLSNYAMQRVIELATREAERVLPAAIEAMFAGKSIHFSDKIVQLSLPGKNGGRYTVNVKIVFG